MTQSGVNLRDKDHVILTHIKDGKNDTHEITQATTLQDYEVRYSLEKLEEHGLIELQKPDGMTERIVNGQKRVFKSPWQATLTENGKQAPDRDQERIESYKDLNRKELIAKVRELENEVQSLQQSFKVFRKQVQRRLD